VNHDGWILGPLLVVSIVAGEVILPMAMGLTGVPQALAREFAKFWGGGSGARVIGAASLYACASIAWGMALVLWFGTRPGG
jgi:hypothetical protein